MSWNNLPLDVKLLVAEWLPADGGGVWQTERDIWGARADWMLRHTTIYYYTRIVDDAEADEAEYVKYNDDKELLDQIAIDCRYSRMVLKRDTDTVTKITNGLPALVVSYKKSRLDLMALQEAILQSTIDNERDNDDHTYLATHRVHIDLSAIDAANTRLEQAHASATISTTRLYECYTQLDACKTEIAEYENRARTYRVQILTRGRKSKHIVILNSMFNIKTTITVFGVLHGFYTCISSYDAVLIYAQYGRAHHDTNEAIRFCGNNVTRIWANNGISARVQFRETDVHARVLTFTNNVIQLGTDPYVAVKLLQYQYTVHPEDKHNSMSKEDFTEDDAGQVIVAGRYLSVNPAHQEWAHRTRDPLGMLPTRIAGSMRYWCYANRNVERERVDATTTIRYRKQTVEQWDTLATRTIMHSKDGNSSEHNADGSVLRDCIDFEVLHQLANVFSWKPQFSSATYGHDDKNTYVYDGSTYTISNTWMTIIIDRHTLAVTYSGNVYCQDNKYYSMVPKNGKIKAYLVIEQTPTVVKVYKACSPLASLNSIWSKDATTWHDDNPLVYGVGSIIMTRQADTITWTYKGRLTEQYNMLTDVLDAYVFDGVSVVHWSTTHAGRTTHTLCPGKNLYADYVGILKTDHPTQTVHEFTDQLVTFDSATRLYTYGTTA